MKRLDCYNLYQGADWFCKLIKGNGFLYDNLNGVISFKREKGKDKLVGRILNSNPPHLVIHSQIPGDETYNNSILKLKKLAEEFKPN